MEPTEALRSIESALRIVIRDALGEKWKTSPGAPDIEKLEARRKEEISRRDGVIVSDDLLNFTETYHLTNIIEKNWQSFNPVFDDMKRTLAYFGILKDVRNSVAHSRDLVPFERDLLSGIVGHLRNQVSLFRSSDDTPTRYYPLIESLKDSFGEAGRNVGAITFGTPLRIDVDQIIAFTGSAFSASSKPVSWWLQSMPEHSVYQEPVKVAEGDDVTIQYAVTESDVSERLNVVIYIRIYSGRGDPIEVAVGCLR